MNRRTVTLIVLIFAALFFFNVLEVSADREKKELYMAQEALTDGFYDVAIETLKDFVENRPKSENINSAYILLGRAYYGKKDFHLALGEFEKIVSSASPIQKDEAFFWLGKIYLENKDLTIAKSSFKNIIDEFPLSELTPYAYYYLAIIANAQGSYEEARKKCDYILEKYSQTDIKESAYLEKAKSLCGLKDFSKSNETLLEFTSLFPQSSLLDEAYFLLGENSFFESKFEAAMNFYDKVREINPGGSKAEEALMKKGLAAFNFKDYESAISIFDDFLQSYQKSSFLPEVSFKKGFALKNTGRNSEAISVFEKAVELCEKAASRDLADDSYLGLADTYYQMGKYEEAISYYSQFNEKFPESPLKEEVFYNLGWTFLRLKRYEEAKEQFQKITQKKISKDEVLKIIALCRLGDTYLDKGDFKQAIIAYDKVLEDYPNSFYGDYAQYQLAVVFEKSDCLDEALMSLNALIVNFPNSKLLDQAYYLSALLHLKRGEYQESLASYESIINNFPSSQYYQISIIGLGYCYYNLKNFKSALDIFNNFEKDFPDSEYRDRVQFETAQVLFASGKEKEAKEKFSKLAKENACAEIKDEARLWLAEYDFKYENYESSYKEFKTLTQESNNNYFKSLAYYWLGKISSLRNEKETACSFFDQARSLSDDENLKIKFNLEKAEVFLGLSRFEKALEIYDDVIENFPGSSFAAVAYKKKADIEFNQGRFISARENYQKALTEIRSDYNAQIEFQIAKAYLEENKLQEAQGALFNVVYIYADSAFWKEKALFEAALIYQKQGKTDEARKIYQKLTQSETEIAQLAKKNLELLNPEF